MTLSPFWNFLVCASEDILASGRQATGGVSISCVLELLRGDVRTDSVGCCDVSIYLVAVVANDRDVRGRLGILRAAAKEFKLTDLETRVPPWLPTDKATLARPSSSFRHSWLT